MNKYLLVIKFKDSLFLHTLNLVYYWPVERIKLYHTMDRFRFVDWC